MDTANTTRGAGKSSSTEWPLGTWIAPPSGVTSKHWMDTASLLGLTSSTVASLASRIARQGVGMEPKTRGTSGPLPVDYLVRFNHGSSSWRTSQGSLPGLETLLPLRTALSLTLPRWVTWDEQGLSKLPTPVRHTHERDGSALQHWSTPTVSDLYTDKLASTQQKQGSKHSVTLAQEISNWPTPDATVFQDNEEVELTLARRAKVKEAANNGNGFGLRLTTVAMAWGTPTAQEISNWPTPDTTEAPNKNSGRKNGPKSLVEAATAGWGTPTSRDWKDGSSVQNVPENRLLVREAVNSLLIGSQTGAESLPSGTRRLNPTFVEWLMGIPWNWTRTDASDLQPWAMR